MYACKRRQRNFKRIRESTRPNQPTNPSKRHRERLNGELETVAALLPYDDATIQRLDKLSVLRLAVSFVQIKAHFALYARQLQSGGELAQLASLAAPNAVYAALSPFGIPICPIPSLVGPQGQATFDINEPTFSQLALKSIGGFVVVLTEWGDLYYVSENIDQYLGFCQSDVLHQPITDLLHSEDREQILKNLRVHQAKGRPGHEKTAVDPMERLMVGRFRCLLDNTCGFVRMEIRGRFVPLMALAGPSEEVVVSKEKNKFLQAPYGFAAICTPFVPPVHLEQALEDPILKTKHGLDLSFLCIDNRLKHILNIDETTKNNLLNFYQFVHPDDAKCLSECHEETQKNGSSAMLVVRMVGQRNHAVYFFQSSFRLFYKAGKAESIGITHRFLTETDGMSLLEKRGTIKGSAFTHDEPSLQSPRNLSTAQNLPTLIPKSEIKVPKIEKSEKRPTTPQRANNAAPARSTPSSSAVLPPIQLSSGSLGAISCLEELVKASTNSFPPPRIASASFKETKPASKKKLSAPQPPPCVPTTSTPVSASVPCQQQQLSTFPTVFPPPYFPPAPEFAPPPAPAPWSFAPTDGMDFSACYPTTAPMGYPGHDPTVPFVPHWFPDPAQNGFNFSENLHHYAAAAQFYPDVAPGPKTGGPGPPADGDIYRFGLPAFGGLQPFDAAKQDAGMPVARSSAAPGGHNLSFLNEMAHTLFG